MRVRITIYPLLTKFLSVGLLLMAESPLPRSQQHRSNVWLSLIRSFVGLPPSPAASITAAPAIQQPPLLYCCHAHIDLTCCCCRYLTCCGWQSSADKVHFFTEVDATDETGALIEVPHTPLSHSSHSSHTTFSHTISHQSIGQCEA